METSADREQERGRTLLREIAAGSADALAEFYDLFAPSVYQLCLKMTKNPAEAEDLCHDVFLEVWHTAKSYDARRGSVKAWLFVKTRSRCLDRLYASQRVIARRTVEPAQEEEASDPTVSAVLRRLERENVRRALNILPAQQRSALVASFFHGQTHREIAQQMKRPLGSVKSLIRYGLQKLRRQIMQTGWSDAAGGGDRE
ncbi:sigma-70 family RNA polymerase sigma factor [Bacillaceae bacterium]